MPIPNPVIRPRPSIPNMRFIILDSGFKDCFAPLLPPLPFNPLFKSGRNEQSCAARQRSPFEHTMRRHQSAAMVVVVVEEEEEEDAEAEAEAEKEKEE
jgi:hypothetical protein